MKKLLSIIASMFLLSCRNSSTNSEESKKSQTIDSTVTNVDMSINREAEPFVVINIRLDSIDAAKNEWQTVELKNSKNQHYWSSGTGVKLKLGDTAMIGHNASGEYIISKNQ